MRQSLSNAIRFRAGEVLITAALCALFAWSPNAALAGLVIGLLVRPRRPWHV